MDGRGAIRAVETRSAPKPTRGYDGFSAGGAPPSEFGGMAGPGHALLASQPRYQADPATLKTFPWHKGQHPAADHRASGRPSEHDDIGVWVSTDDPAERAYALDVARRRA